MFCFSGTICWNSPDSIYKKAINHGDSAKIWIVPSLSKCQAHQSILPWHKLPNQPRRTHARNILWGYVGQFEYAFKPCRTSSSARISNVPYVILNSFKRPIVVLEKPQRGVSGVPFMKSMTSWDRINALRRCSSASGEGGRGFAAENFWRVDVSRGAFAPSTTATRLLFW